MAITASEYEEILAGQLDAAGITYIREYVFHEERKWRHDFYLPDFNLAIEIEGITYGNSPGAHQRGVGYQSDCKKYNESGLQGIRLLRFTPAMVTGKAKDTIKGKPRMEPAIDTIKRWITAYNNNWLMIPQT